jgi:hypothetical protein
MSDPERISKRSTGLSAQLLRAGADEQPGEAGVERTLLALGISGAVLTSAGATSAAAGGVKVASALSSGVGGANAMGVAASGTAKAVSALVLAKWIGIGVVSGVGLAGAAALVTSPAVLQPPAKAAISAPVAVAPLVVATPAPAKPSAVEAAPVAEVTPSVVAPAPHVSVAEPAPAAPGFEVGAPLAAEVAFVDRARALLAAGQTEAGLSMLQGYEREFPEARLLPEVLFLRMETCERLGRASEARGAAQRLLEGFPKSPHASRARKLLDK